MEAVISLIICLMIIIDQIWGKDTPIIPPSISALLRIETERMMNMTMGEEVYHIFGNIQYHYFAVSIGIFEGIMIGWNMILIQVLRTHYLGYNDDLMVRVMCILIILAMICGMIMFGFIANKFEKPLFKEFIVSLKILSGIFLFIFTLSANKLIIFPTLYFGLISCLLAVSMNGAIYGIIYEAAVENMYPARHILAGIILTCYIKIFGTIFTIIFQYVDPSMINWILCISQFLSAVLLYFHRQKYDRYKLDTATMKLEINSSKSTSISFVESAITKDEDGPFIFTDDDDISLISCI